MSVRRGRRWHALDLTGPQADISALTCPGLWHSADTLLASHTVPCSHGLGYQDFCSPLPFDMQYAPVGSCSAPGLQCCTRTRDRSHLRNMTCRACIVAALDVTALMLPSRHVRLVIHCQELQPPPYSKRCRSICTASGARRMRLIDLQYSRTEHVEQLDMALAAEVSSATCPNPSQRYTCGQCQPPGDAHRARDCSLISESAQAGSGLQHACCVCVHPLLSCDQLRMVVRAWQGVPWASVRAAGMSDAGKLLLPCAGLRWTAL